MICYRFYCRTCQDAWPADMVTLTSLAARAAHIRFQRILIININFFSFSSCRKKALQMIYIHLYGGRWCSRWIRLLAECPSPSSRWSKLFTPHLYHHYYRYRYVRLLVLSVFQPNNVCLSARNSYISFRTCVRTCVNDDLDILLLFTVIHSDEGTPNDTYDLFDGSKCAPVATIYNHLVFIAS